MPRCAAAEPVRPGVAGHRRADRARCAARHRFRRRYGLVARSSGSSACRTVPVPRGLSRESRPPSASTRSLRPRSPVPPVRVGAAGAVVADRDAQDASGRRRGRRSTLTARRGVLGGVGQRLGDDVVGGDLDLLGQPLLDAHVELDRDRRAAGERLERRAQPALGEDRRVDAAGDLAQLVQRAGRLGGQRVQLRASSPARAAPPPGPRAASGRGRPAAAGRRRAGRARCAGGPGRRWRRSARATR